MLMLKKDKAICNSCGFVVYSKLNLSSMEKLPEKEEIGEGSVKGENIFATYEHKCEKCGYDKAQIIDCGVFYSDEDSIIFLKCGKCGFSEKIGKES
jgi:DNA-directed RNA polymerase subunit M/transcription elongation factor TFIIS